MTTVGIIEDHPIFRQGLSQAIESGHNLALVFAVSSVEEFREQPERPDVVILDLGLPGASGAEAVRVVGGDVPVLVVSAEGRRQDVLDAISAGAKGYLTKAADTQEVVDAIGVVARGGSYVSPTLASFLLQAALPGRRGSGLSLTDREREILALLASGERDQDIADQLYISVRTVRSHLDRIREKTGHRRRPDLTRLALREGLIPPTEPKG